MVWDLKELPRNPVVLMVIFILLKEEKAMKLIVFTGFANTLYCPISLEASEQVCHTLIKTVLFLFLMCISVRLK